jgi:hypothetical protein
MEFKKLQSVWESVAGGLFDRVYEESGPRKREIEDMRTDREYEVRVIECAVTAYDNWEYEGKPDFRALSEDEQVELVQDALDNGRYGSYRGNAGDYDIVVACL